MPDLCGVYIIESKGLWKIGMTISFKQRFASYKTQNPHIGKVLFIESRIPPILEVRLHRKYRQYRTRGEWFRLPSECVVDLRKKWNARLLADLDLQRHRKKLKEFDAKIKTTGESWESSWKQTRIAFDNHMKAHQEFIDYLESLS